MKTVHPPTRVDRVVDSLVEADLIAQQDRPRAVDVVAAALRPETDRAPEGEGQPGAARRGVSALVEVVAYLGAALVLAAGSLFAVEFWGDLGFASQVGVLAVMLVALGAAGVATISGHVAEVREGGAESRRRLASTLLVGAAASGAALTGLVADRAGVPNGYDSVTYAQDGVDWITASACLVGLVLVLVGRRLADSALATLGLFVVLTTLVPALVDTGDEGLALAVALLVVAVAWVLLLEVGRLAAGHLTLGRLLGAGLALFAAQVPVMWSSGEGGDLSWLGYLLTVVVAVVATGAYLARSAWPYLAVAVLAVTVVVPEMVSDWTGGGLGAIGGVLVTGVALLLASLVGGWLHSRAR